MSLPDDFGKLTLADLDNRAEAAFAYHMRVYTASEILHDLFLVSLDQDPDFCETLSAVIDRLRTYQAETRAAWRKAQRERFLAAGIPWESDEDEQVSDDLDRERL